MRPTDYGPGDEATWGECTGHPNDPRTDDESEECDAPALDASRDPGPDDDYYLGDPGHVLADRAARAWAAGRGL